MKKLTIYSMISLCIVLSLNLIFVISFKNYQEKGYQDKVKSYQYYMIKHK